MLPRLSIFLIIALAAPAFVALAFGQDEKPSPVPSRAKKPDAPRSVEKAPAREPEAALSDSPQSGSAVFFSNNVRGKKSASGVLLDPDELIAAHASLPFGTLLRVTNLKNGKEVTVRVVDRISSGSGHIISVSEKAASELDFRREGIGQVRISPLAPANP